MVVRIRFPRGGRVQRETGRSMPAKNAHLASVAGGVITMFSVVCLLLALWRLTSDLEWTGAFFVPDGLLSHWQVWLALTFASGALALRLQRYSRIEESLASEAENQPDDGSTNETADSPSLQSKVLRS